MIEDAAWIRTVHEKDDICPEFYTKVHIKKDIKSAQLYVSAAGMYEAYIDGKKIGDEMLTPYWTEYSARTQYQTYDVKDMLGENSELSFICAEGWAVGAMAYSRFKHSWFNHISLIYSLDIEYMDGEKQSFVSGENTFVRTSQILSSSIYDGEIVDKTVDKFEMGNALIDEVNTTLIPQEGEKVCEQNRISAVKYFVTPNGERVIDFGQNIAGYAEIRIRGSRGDRIRISHAEVLDCDGNFYTDNLRSAKQSMTYVLAGDGEEVLKPHFSWQGFRYIRLDEYPYRDVELSGFTACAIHSDMKRTGDFSCGLPEINQLYNNIVWGQKGNFIDVPTDCPQRDERLGWTGDAQVFVRTAAINYDVERFFKKWLADLAYTQGENGAVTGIVPMVRLGCEILVSAGWGDAAVICPWEIYRAYGNKDILECQFESMKAWIDYMHSFGKEEYLWLGGEHYGDWLAMDGDEYIGATSADYIASAFFAYSTGLFVKAGKVINKDISDYEKLYDNITKAFKDRFTKNGVPIERTQTAYALALHFGLCDNRELTGEGLVKMIEENEMRLTTGFVGTPYLLHALTEADRTDVAYELLLQDKSPSWLFSVKQGATTMWEHWDGIKEDGTFWSDDMNSYNHYAYGSVYDWIFGVCAGIQVHDDGAGYKHISVKPKADKRLGFLTASIETRHGLLVSSWRYENDRICYEVTIPEGCIAEAEFTGNGTVCKEVLTEGHYKRIMLA